MEYLNEKTGFFFIHNHIIFRVIGFCATSDLKISAVIETKEINFVLLFKLDHDRTI